MPGANMAGIAVPRCMNDSDPAFPLVKPHSATLEKFDLAHRLPCYQGKEPPVVYEPAAYHAVPHVHIRIIALIPPSRCCSEGTLRDIGVIPIAHAGFGGHRHLYTFLPSLDCSPEARTSSADN
jgi:hypothetical protein